MTSARPLVRWTPFLVLGLGLSCGPGASESPAIARPSMLFVLADDLGYGDLACYGNPIARTPHLDRLAGEGVRLTHAYAAAPNCSPSRAALLTGRIPQRLGIYDFITAGSPMQLSTEETTVAERLREAGYQTVFVGKWHLTGGRLAAGAGHGSDPGDHGFEHWLASERSWDVDPAGLVRNGAPAGPLQGTPGEVAVDEVLRWLSEDRDRSRPFFIHLSLSEMHGPLRAPPEYVRRYGDIREALGLLADGGPDVPHENRDPAQSPRYFGTLEHMDAELGRLFAALEEHGLARDTFVFFTSDNGPEHRGPASFGSPGPLRGAKGYVHEGGIRVPAIARWPGRIPAGTECAVPFHGTDLFATLCAVAGIEPRSERELDGTDALPALLGCQPLGHREPLFWWLHHSRGGKQVALRDGDRKLLARMVHPHPTLEDLRPPPGVSLMDFIKQAGLEDFELYDVVRDPGETRELSALEPERRAELERELVRLYAQVQAEAPVVEVPASGEEE